jgi:hypothetical protein
MPEAIIEAKPSPDADNQANRRVDASGKPSPDEDNQANRRVDAAGKPSPGENNQADSGIDATLQEPPDNQQRPGQVEQQPVRTQQQAIEEKKRAIRTQQQAIEEREEEVYGAEFMRQRALRMQPCTSRYSVLEGYDYPVTSYDGWTPSEEESDNCGSDGSNYPPHSKEEEEEEGDPVGSDQEAYEPPSPHNKTKIE